MNKLIMRQFEQCHIGNGWGNFVDIENMKYDINMRSLPLVKKDVHSFHIHNVDKNVTNDNKNTNKSIKNLIIRISSTTFVSIAFVCFVYRSL